MNDPYDLSRFVPGAAGRLRTSAVGNHQRPEAHALDVVHLPAARRAGVQPNSKRYAIKSVEEARAYLEHPILGPRLLNCAEAVVGVEGRSAAEIFGSPDDLKLKSCATLFSSVAPPGSVFDRLLEKYYRGERDGKTLELLGGADTRGAEL